MANNLVTEAEKRISKMLAELERQMDGVVESIEIRDIEITTCSDDRPQWQRRVLIEMKRLPGTRWDG